MNMKTIFPVFVNKALKNENLVLSGAGTRKQTYIHVDDISQAIEKALISNAQGVYLSLIHILPHITVLAQMLWMRVIMDMQHMRRI